MELLNHRKDLAREAEEAMLASQEDMDDLIDNDDEIEMMEQAG